MFRNGKKRKHKELLIHWHLHMFWTAPYQAWVRQRKESRWPCTAKVKQNVDREPVGSAPHSITCNAMPRGASLPATDRRGHLRNEDLSPPLPPARSRPPNNPFFSSANSSTAPHVFLANLSVSYNSSALPSGCYAGRARFVNHSITSIRSSSELSVEFCFFNIRSPIF